MTLGVKKHIYLRLNNLKKETHTTFFAVEFVFLLFRSRSLAQRSTWTAARPQPKLSLCSALRGHGAEGEERP